MQDLNLRYPNWLNGGATYASWNILRHTVDAARSLADRQKAEINAIYQKIIPINAWLGPEFNDWRFNIKVPKKSALLKKIFAAGLFASGHYRPTAQILGGPAAPNATDLDRQVVNLFNDHHIDPAKAEKVANIVRDHLEHCATIVTRK